VLELLDLGVTRFMAFPGFFERFVPPNAEAVRVFNATLSSITGDPGQRRLATPLLALISMGADAICVHASLGVSAELDTLTSLARVIAEAHDLGLPVIAAMYDRRSPSDQSDHEHLLQRGARIALELGADAVKTSYTGSSSSFEKIVTAAGSLPVFVAGGPYESDENTLAIAKGALRAGASGFFFGRTLSEAKELPTLLQELTSLK